MAVGAEREERFPHCAAAKGAAVPVGMTAFVSWCADEVVFNRQITEMQLNHHAAAMTDD
jgi:sRNA-binding protein